MTEPNTYSDAGLDRAAHLRRDDVWLAERLVDPPTRFVPVWRARNLINGGADPRAAVLSRAALEAHLDDAAERLADSVLLGLADGAACFALDLSDIDEGLAETLGTDAGFCDLRQYGSLLPGNDAGLLAYARGILYWHRRHRFCGSCGAPTDVEEGGHLRICTDETCATPHFPRTDPAVIMLIERDGRCLLGRQKSWAPGLYSTLAGFVEPGESLEDAVRREVYEEAGIDVGRVDYHSSQPWPFPTSLMLGFNGQALSESIAFEAEELEDARWFTRDELAKAGDWLAELDLAQAGDGALRLPNRDSISRRLIDDWRTGPAT